VLTVWVYEPDPLQTYNQTITLIRYGLYTLLANRKIMVYIIISEIIRTAILFYLINQVNRNRKLIHDLAKATKKLAEKTLKL
jgi:multisubunit Na+/H+ antiporter MnhC subunit